MCIDEGLECSPLPVADPKIKAAANVGASPSNTTRVCCASLLGVHTAGGPTLRQCVGDARLAMDPERSAELRRAGTSWSRRIWRRSCTSSAAIQTVTAELSSPSFIDMALGRVLASAFGLFVCCPSRPEYNRQPTRQTKRERTTVYNVGS